MLISNEDEGLLSVLIVTFTLNAIIITHGILEFRVCTISDKRSQFLVRIMTIFIVIIVINLIVVFEYHLLFLALLGFVIDFKIKIVLLLKTQS